MRPDSTRIRHAFRITVSCLGMAIVALMVAREVRYLHGYFKPSADLARQEAPITWKPAPPTLPTLQDLPPGLLKVSGGELK